MKLEEKSEPYRIHLIKAFPPINFSYLMNKLEIIIRKLCKDLG